MKVFAFKYNPMIEESSYATISLHEIKKGAELAMELHKSEKKQEWKVFDRWRRKEYGDRYKLISVTPFGFWERWIVEEIEVLK